MSTDVVVLDYGFGNIRSAERALERVGATVEVTADPRRARTADGLVVPGVGAFAACMTGLEATGGAAIVGERVAAGAPVLGICVGMQVLFEAGTEHGVYTPGLGLLAGEVGLLSADVLPHMGWNTVTAAPDSVLLAGLDPEERFYFVHSYAARRTDPSVTVSTTAYGGPFVAVAERGCLSACQFHPEKSADAGAALLHNWMRSL